MRVLQFVLAVTLVLAIASGALAQAPAASASRGDVEGRWSDPPGTPEDHFCRVWCTETGVARLRALLDDPANDLRPYEELRVEADRHQRENYLRPRLTDAAAGRFPAGAATDPSLLHCEPWGLARQPFSRFQMEIARVGDGIEMRYSQWAARRVVFMDGRPLPTNAPPMRLGYSVGRYEGDTLVIESTGAPRHRAVANTVDVSEHLHLVERYTRSADGTRLWLTATIIDPLTFREPIVLKKVWRSAPDAEIGDQIDCERPGDLLKR
jgi:hypothetical protein